VGIKVEKDLKWHNSAMVQRRKGAIAEQHNNPMSKQKDPLLGEPAPPSGRWINLKTEKVPGRKCRCIIYRNSLFHKQIKLTLD